MDDTLDFKSFIPLYQQLKNIIHENIEKKIWQTDDKIPSENEMMERYFISRNTVKKALDDLVKEGVLNRVKGKGTFIAPPKIEQSLSGFYSFSKVMKSKGIKDKDIIISIKTVYPSVNVARQLNISQNEETIKLQRLRCANKEPIIFEISYMPKKYVSYLSYENLEKNSLYDFLRKEFNIFINSAKETFEPILTQEYESDLLNIDIDSPALLLDRIAYDVNGYPVEFCSSVVRGDRCRFYTNLL